MLQRSLAVMISIQENGSIVFPALDPGMPRTDRKIIADYYKRLIDIWLLEAQPNSSASFKCQNRVSATDTEQLLKNMSRFYLHKQMFGGTQGSLLGTLGYLISRLTVGKNQG